MAHSHPLAALDRPALPADLEPHVQLVLSDPLETQGANYGLASARLWRFIDLGRRLDFLLAGLGWCRMPDHVVAAPIARGQVVRFQIEDDPTPREGLTIYAAHRRDRGLGPGGRRLCDELRQRLM
ncbi:LysR substrate-binding domain-containing protein [Novosphingobium sp. UBA1939]|uniref:LysR substrate-binding domain-containing protein n=1 Tax=Novosphingobium sp. UBA1939 TaxID=1946982 RepID=UPI0039C95FF6